MAIAAPGASLLNSLRDIGILGGLSDTVAGPDDLTRLMPLWAAFVLGAIAFAVFLILTGNAPN